MKRISAIALIVAASFLSAGSVFAQDNRVKAEIPFSFTVGNTVLPAGTYTVSAVTSSYHTILLQSRDQDAHVLTMGQPNQSNPDQASKLVFYRYGNQYFLHEIRSANSSMNIDLAASKAEKRAKAQTESAALPVSGPIMIALR